MLRIKKRRRLVSEREHDINNASYAKMAMTSGHGSHEEKPEGKDHSRGVSPRAIANLLSSHFEKRRHGEKMTIRGMLSSPARAMDFIPFVIPEAIMAENRKLEQSIHNNYS